MAILWAKFTAWELTKPETTSEQVGFQSEQGDRNIQNDRISSQEVQSYQLVWSRIGKLPSAETSFDIMFCSIALRGDDVVRPCTVGAQWFLMGFAKVCHFTV